MKQRLKERRYSNGRRMGYRYLSRVNRVDDDGTVNYRLEVFFGNDTVTISPPPQKAKLRASPFVQRQIVPVIRLWTMWTNLALLR